MGIGSYKAWIEDYSDESEATFYPSRDVVGARNVATKHAEAFHRRCPDAGWPIVVIVKCPDNAMYRYVVGMEFVPEFWIETATVKSSTSGEWVDLMSEIRPKVSGH